MSSKGSVLQTHVPEDGQDAMRSVRANMQVQRAALLAAAQAAAEALEQANPHLAVSITMSETGVLRGHVSPRRTARPA